MLVAAVESYEDLGENEEEMGDEQREDAEEEHKEQDSKAKPIPRQTLRIAFHGLSADAIMALPADKKRKESGKNGELAKKRR